MRKNGCRSGGAADANAPPTRGRDSALPSGPRGRWSLDFLSEALRLAQVPHPFRMADDFTRECLAPLADSSSPGIQKVRELEALVSRCERPITCASDNGTELISLGVVKRARTAASRHYTAPASRSRTPSSKASMADSGTSATRRYSRRSTLPRPCCPPGRATTPLSDDTQVSRVCNAQSLLDERSDLLRQTKWVNGLMDPCSPPLNVRIHLDRRFSAEW